MALDEDRNSNHPITRQIRGIIGFFAGGVMIAAALYAAWLLIGSGPNPSADGAIAIYIGAAGFIAVLVFMGSRMIVSVISIQKEVIPSRDRALLEPLIIAGDEKAIDQYVRLSSLTGATGLATKLGLTGLPLLTVALTLIFAGLELYKPGAGFMDLTKLTLGAFIGSFVQRVATSQQAASIGSGRLPPVA
jgi:hypothetical protein